MAQNQSYETKMYSLDVIISVGYRVKSINGTKFRIWANSGSTAPMWFCAEFGHKAVIHLMSSQSAAVMICQTIIMPWLTQKPAPPSHYKNY